MANRYNTYIPTQYIGMPIADYQVALGTIDNKATQKVQDLGRRFASFNDITPTGRDASAFYQQTLGDLRQKIQGVNKKNLTSFDATNQIQQMISDPETLNSFRNIYQDTMDFNAMQSAIGEYRKKNPDINLLPALQRLRDLDKQQGVAGNYKPGMFRGMNSFTDFYDIPKAVYGAVEKMKANKDTWQKLVGNKIYTTTEEALTDSRVRNAAFATLFADQQAMDQVQRNMDYEAFRMSPDDQAGYLNKVGEDYRSDLKADLTHNQGLITSLKESLKSPPKGFDVKGAQAQIRQLETQNSGLETVIGSDARALGRRSFMNRYSDAATALFPYHDRSQTWKYDDIYLKDIDFQHRLALYNRKKADDDARAEKLMSFLRPEAMVQPRLNIVGTEIDKPGSTEVFQNKGGLSELTHMASDIKSLDFNKKYKVESTLDDLLYQGVLTKEDLLPATTQREGLFSPLETKHRELSAKGLKKLHDLGYENIVVGKNTGGDISYFGKPDQKKLIQELKKQYGDLDFNVGQGFNTGQKDAQGKPIYKNITLNENMSSQDLKSYLERIAQFEYDNNSQGVNVYSYSGPARKQYEAEMNRDVAATLPRRNMIINNKPATPGNGELLVTVNGKKIPFREALTKENIPFSVQPGTDGVLYNVYEVDDEKGKKMTIRVEGTEGDNAAIAGPAAVARSVRNEILPDGYGGAVYVENSLQPSSTGSLGKAQTVITDVGHAALQPLAQNYIFRYINTLQQAGGPAKSYQEHEQDALKHLDEIYQLAQSQGKQRMFDGLTGTEFPLLLRPLKSPDGTYAVQRDRQENPLYFVSAPQGVTLPNGQTIGGTRSAKEYEQATIGRRFEENSLQRLQMRQPAKHTLGLADVLGITDSGEDDYNY